MNRGFSLVELSIVLVILGLLTGGILAGQSLIRAAELRSVATEYQRWVTASHTFRDKYFAMPGDMSNATSFWGKDNAACAGHTGTAATPGTCNGNGDGRMDTGNAINATGEFFQFWKQLALAGLVEGNYSGLAGPTATHAGYDHVLGTNSPQSKLSNGGWGVRWLGNFAGDAYTYTGNYGNMLAFGAIGGDDLPNWWAIKPEEAWNIDMKVDDGKPGTGKAIARNWNMACAESSSQTDTAASYNLDSNTVACAFYFPNAL